METYDSSTYGDRIADVYDAWHSTTDNGMIDALAEQARGGRVLELGIGTGRVALPLAERGIDVHGVDASEKMVARLREKPCGKQMPVLISDFSEFDAGTRFSLVYVVFNTFFGLLTQDAQLRCFESVSRQLERGGRFVIEAFVPDPTRFHLGQSTETRRVEPDRVMLVTTTYDPIGQRTSSQHVLLTENGLRFFPVAIRFAWPSELDLMARIAGMSLRERWGGWQQEPFTASSGKHVSVYERAD